MPCDTHDHAHIWPTSGPLYIDNCERYCGYCTDPELAGKQWKWRCHLLKHVQQAHINHTHPDVTVDYQGPKLKPRTKPASKPAARGPTAKASNKNGNLRFHPYQQGNSFSGINDGSLGFGNHGGQNMNQSMGSIGTVVQPSFVNSGSSTFGTSNNFSALGNGNGYCNSGSEANFSALNTNNTINPYGNNTNPYGNTTNPYGNTTNPYGNATHYGGGNTAHSCSNDNDDNNLLNGGSSCYFVNGGNPVGFANGNNTNSYAQSNNSNSFHHGNTSDSIVNDSHLNNFVKVGNNTQYGNNDSLNAFGNNKNVQSFGPGSYQAPPEMNNNVFSLPNSQHLNSAPINTNPQHSTESIPAINLTIQDLPSGTNSVQAPVNPGNNSPAMLEIMVNMADGAFDFDNINDSVFEKALKVKEARNLTLATSPTSSSILSRVKQRPSPICTSGFQGPEGDKENGLGSAKSKSGTFEALGGEGPANEAIPLSSIPSSVSTTFEFLNDQYLTSDNIFEMLDDKETQENKTAVESSPVIADGRPKTPVMAQEANQLITPGATPEKKETVKVDIASSELEIASTLETGLALHIRSTLKGLMKLSQCMGISKISFMQKLHKAVKWLEEEK